MKQLWAGRFCRMELLTAGIDIISGYTGMMLTVDG
jgi:hypothetical protein